MGTSLSFSPTGVVNPGVGRTIRDNGCYHKFGGELNLAVGAIHVIAIAKIMVDL